MSLKKFKQKYVRSYSVTLEINVTFEYHRNLGVSLKDAYYKMPRPLNRRVTKLPLSELVQ